MIQLSTHKNLEEFLKEKKEFIIGNEANAKDPYIHIIDNGFNVLKNVKNHKNLKLVSGNDYIVSKKNHKNYGLTTGIYLGKETTVKVSFVFDKETKTIIKYQNTFSNSFLFKTSNGIEDFSSFYEVLSENNVIDESIQLIHSNRIFDYQAFRAKLEDEISYSIEYAIRQQYYKQSAYIVELKVFDLFQKKHLEDIIFASLKKFEKQ